jgi:DNA-directed RNA polymerase II subunit RPB2
VNGNEKSVVAQEKMRTNFIFVRKLGPRAVCAEIRSLHASKTRSTSTLTVQLSARAGLHAETTEVRLPFVDLNIPIGVIFKILGLDSADQITAFIADQSEPQWSDGFRDVVHRCVDHPLLAHSRAFLIEHLGREGTKEATSVRRIRYIEHIIANEFLPHQGLDASPETLHRKAVYLALIVIKLVRVHINEQPPDDRDDYALKRIESTGGLFALRGAPRSAAHSFASSSASTSRCSSST